MVIKLSPKDTSKIEELYNKSEIGYAEYKLLTRLALYEKEINPDTSYIVTVDTRTYRFLGDDLISILEIYGFGKEEKSKKNLKELI